MDDLLDLNWTTGSSSSKAAASPAVGLSAGSTPTSRAASPATYSAFDSLASASSNYTPNYTSSYTGQSSHTRENGTPVPIGRTPSPNPSINATKPQPSSSSSRDAFDSLFESAGSSTTSQKARESSLTLQDKIRLQSSDLGFSQPINGGMPQKTSSDPWDFDMLSPAVSPKPTQQVKVPITRTISPFDMFDDLEATATSASQISINVQSHAVAGPTLANDANDDILGLLGKPVNTAKPSASVQVVAPRPARKSPVGSSPPSSSFSRPPSRPTAARTPSPPPHILGEVVSMGFSVQQARLALAATLGAEQPGKWSINAAMDILASDGAAHAARDRENASSPRRPFDDENGEDEDAYLRRQARKQTERPVQNRERASRRREEDRDGENSPSQSTAEMTANELLQQASVFGSSMLKSANSYWKTSRAQIQKAIEEKKLAIPSVSGPTSGRSSPANAKPRWMMADTDFAEETPKGEGSNREPPTGHSFRDFDQEEQITSQGALPSHSSERSGYRSEQRRSEKVSIPALSIERTHGQSHTDATNGALQHHSASLLDVTQNEKKSYTSPHRRKMASSSSSSSAPVSADPTRSPVVAQAKAKPSRPPRPHIAASSSQLENSRKRRVAGNEHFKLGRYGDAATEYTSALEALPEGHIACVAALNNRANARLKNGEERRAAEDATVVLSILCAPTELQKVTREIWDVILHDFKNTTTDVEAGEKFDANDALGKALSRRARGYEGCEKWRLAMLDWQMINELGDAAVVKSAGGMRVVSEGLSRCRKIVEGPSPKPTSAGPPKRAPPPRAPKPATSARPVRSDAVDKLRETNEKAEADEAERLVVKDAVDAKITEWRAGKDINLRALIASLDNVLWDELGWKKVGMHELITDSQLKIKYVRAISKVHPDKLGPDLPVERKLIANAVFGTLSDAWNAHNS